MDTDKIKIFGARVRTDSAATVGAIEVAERAKMRAKVESMIATGCNVVVNRQLIYNLGETIFAEAGVAAIEHADFSGIERLALVTGGEIASTFDEPGTAVLGEADLVEEIMIGEESLIRFSGVKCGEACTIVLRGPSRHILDEAERSIHDALCVLAKTVDEPRIVWGAGVSELRMARAVDEVATRTEGKRQLAIEAFATALRRLPTIICDNAGCSGRCCCCFYDLI
jgi:T-complex protein 1 subunit beta